MHQENLNRYARPPWGPFLEFGPHHKYTFYINIRLYIISGGLDIVKEKEKKDSTNIKSIY